VRSAHARRQEGHSAPALENWGGFNIKNAADHCGTASMLHRPCRLAGEDRNTEECHLVARVGHQQHRPSRAGEDRNNPGNAAQPASATVAAPARGPVGIAT